MNLLVKHRLAMITLSLILVLSSVAIPSCSNRGKITISNPLPQAQNAVTIPDEYSNIYSKLESTLDQFNAFLDKQGEPRNPTIFGAELLPANCNRGEDLLKPGVASVVKLYLYRLQELGVQGVTIPIHYPLYTPQFPRFTEYVSFYKQVAQEIRNRGMKLDIESHVLFANTTFSPVKWDYSKLTFDQYKTARRGMITQIIDDLHPDFLNIGAEPDTEATLLGMKDLLDPQKYTDYIAYLLDRLERGDTKVVAGVGSWGNLDYARKLTAQPVLDGLSLHIYPVIGDCLTKAVQIAELAKTNNKFVVFDECWLSKTDVLPTSGVASAPETFKRDAYNFWAPLDEKFLTVMVRFPRLYGVVYLSPFWTGFFFAYLDFSPQISGLSYSNTAAALAPAQSSNVRNGQFTTTGEKYRTLIILNRGEAATAPASQLPFPDHAKLGTVERDVTYGNAGGLPLKLDIYYPRVASKAAPAVVYVHGGGWTQGDKSTGAGATEIPELVNRGFLVASVNYRLAPQYKFPAQIEDVKCAIRFLRANAATYGINPYKIGAWGGSAGGHLVALLGTTDGGAGLDGSGGYSNQSSRIQAVVDMFGPTDLSVLFRAYKGPVLEQVFGTSDPDSPIIKLASPVNYISSDDPPFLIIHDDKDALVPLEQSQILYNRLLVAGVSTKLVVVKNAGHGFNPEGGAISPTRSEITKMVADFFDQHLN